MAPRPSQEDIEEAFESLDPQEGQDPALFRTVWPSGALVQKDKYNKKGKFGWTIRSGKAVPYTANDIAIAVALAAKGRRENYDQRRKAKGQVKVTVWVPQDKVEELQGLAAKWRGESE